MIGKYLARAIAIAIVVPVFPLLFAVGAWVALRGEAKHASGEGEQ